MCWCTPGLRTPCCGKPSCHHAARDSGKLGADESCPFCRPAAKPKPELNPALQLARKLKVSDYGRQKAQELRDHLRGYGTVSLSEVEWECLCLFAGLLFDEAVSHGHASRNFGGPLDR